MERVEDHREGERRGEREHLLERPALVVLDHEPGARVVREPREPGREASRCRLRIGRARPTWSTILCDASRPSDVSTRAW